MRLKKDAQLPKAVSEEEAQRGIVSMNHWADIKDCSLLLLPSTVL